MTTCTDLAAKLSRITPKTGILHRNDGEIPIFASDNLPSDPGFLRDRHRHGHHRVTTEQRGDVPGRMANDPWV